MITDIQLLYFGNSVQGERLGAAAAQHGAHVLCADSLIAALGMYITLFPNVTVIDAAHPDSEAIYQHLRSVDAAPILVLVDETVLVLWTLRHDILRAHGVLTISRHLSASVLLDTAAHLANGLSLVNGDQRRAG